jgi:hypothetical protein
MNGIFIICLPLPTTKFLCPKYLRYIYHLRLRPLTYWQLTYILIVVNLTYPTYLSSFRHKSLLTTHLNQTFMCKKTFISTTQVVPLVFTNNGCLLIMATFQRFISTFFLLSHSMSLQWELTQVSFQVLAQVLHIHNCLSFAFFSKLFIVI